MLITVKGALRTVKYVVILAILAFAAGLGVYVACEVAVEARLLIAGLVVGVVLGSVLTAFTCRLAYKETPPAKNGVPGVLPEGFVFMPGQAQVPRWYDERCMNVKSDKG